MTGRTDALRIHLMKPNQLLSALTAGCFLFGSAALAAADATPEKTGLAVGAKVPSFALKDQNDRDVSLEVLLKKGPVALVFYRSADW